MTGPATPDRRPTPSRLRRVAGYVAIGGAVAAGAFALHQQRESLDTSLAEIGLRPVFAALAVGVLGVALTFLEWRRVLQGLDVDLPFASAARVFFISQLGKYVPGSVWPVVMQMEAGRAHGASRRTMLTGNLLTLALGCTVGLLLAAALLPFAAPGALQRYWWTLPALPALLLLLWPPVLPALMNRLFGLIGREPLEQELPIASALRASGWAAASFAALGVHVALLAAPLSQDSLGVLLVLAVGVIALAICAGVIAIPVPAGAGVRDAVLALGLATQLDLAEAIVVAVASRALLVVADLLLALAVLPLGVRRDRPAPRPIK